MFFVAVITDMLVEVSYTQDRRKEWKRSMEERREQDEGVEEGGEERKVQKK